MSTPSLDRSHSRSSLETSSESDSKELEKQNQKKKAEPSNQAKVPSTSNRTLKRAGTWSMGYMPKQKTEKETSDPLLSPRKPEQAQPKAPSSSSTSSTPSTSAPIPPATGSGAITRDNRVFAKDLSPKVLSYASAGMQVGGRLAPERLGELLVAVESKGGAIKLAGDNIKRILRGALVIRDFMPEAGEANKDANVIKRICEPFMYWHLDTPAMEKGRKKFIGEFGRIAEKFEGLSKEIQQKEWSKSSRMKKLMDPIMDPVIRLICGSENTLESSKLPDQVKKVLLSIDKHVIAWFLKNGTGKPADLLDARKSALIGFLSTRSLGYVWLTRSQDEKALAVDHLTRLMSYMNSYVSTQIDAFVVDILLKQPDQPVEARKYIEVLTKKTTLKSKPSVPKLALGAGSTLSADKLLSPRTPASSTTHRLTNEKTSSEKADQKKAKADLMKMRVERARFVDQLAKDAGLEAIDYQCYMYVKDIVIKMSRRGFDHFKKDPVRSYAKYADEHYGKIENHGKVKAGLPLKVKNGLDALSLKLLGNPFDEPEVAKPVAKKEASEQTDESSATEPSDETEVETESSTDDTQS